MYEQSYYKQCVLFSFPGYVSYVDAQSYYINELVNVIAKHARKEDMYTLLTRVRFKRNPSLKIHTYP